MKRAGAFIFDIVSCFNINSFVADNIEINLIS